MRYEMIFLTAVLGIAAIHLISNLVNFMSKFKRPQVQESRKQKAPSDWYVFFDKAALYGDTASEVAESELASPEVVDNDSDHADTYPPQKAYA